MKDILKAVADKDRKNVLASSPLLAEVAFPLPLHRQFDYLIPDEFASALKPGHRVRAPFGPRPQVGIVMDIHSRPLAAAAEKPIALKSIETILDPEPALDEKDLRLARWIAEYYFCSLGEAVFCVLPLGKKLAPKRNRTQIPAENIPIPVPEQLTPNQAAALEKILPAVDSARFSPFLLLGVAASGKTEVYLRSAERVLAQGRSVLYLVPEIGLTPQTEMILRSRFKDEVCVWHSEISQGERWRVLQRVKSGQCRVLLGPRSAVFLPMKNLGLIVVDEEHDASYKEDTRPHYHARDVALQKARMHDAALILGSATPSMESYRAAREGVLSLVEMPHRVEERPFPQVQVVDIRRFGFRFLSEPLAQAVIDTLAKKEQCLLFLNRRGFATYVACPNCGWEAKCPNCGVNLVYHKGQHATHSDANIPADSLKEGLHCHYCFHHMSIPPECPDCRRETVKISGRGTQRIMEDLKTWFPGARALRWDRDSTRKRGAHARAFQAIRSDEVDIVVGTQMIAQGLDFPLVTLVGVVDADQSLRFPDFRSSERTFQLLTQVAGRAGRGHTPGRVFLQTRHPDHYAVQASLSFDYKKFAEAELTFRQETLYPPFVRLVQLILKGKEPEKVEKGAADFLDWLETRHLSDQIHLLGPAPAFRLLRESQTHWQILAKAPADKMAELFSHVREYKPPRPLSLSIHVDPEEMQ